MKRHDTNGVWIYSPYVILFLSCTIFKTNLHHLSSIFSLKATSPTCYMNTVKNKLDLQPKIFQNLLAVTF